jgi:uncharacterized protein
MELEGRVSNVTNFGAFVDIGVKRDGLVHPSQLSDRWVEDPRSVVQVGQVVRVLEVDQERGRIGLSMRARRDVRGARARSARAARARTEHSGRRRRVRRRRVRRRRGRRRPSRTWREGSTGGGKLARPDFEI